jgi:2-polyprenyl-3-methyl-5-hydroxy-6-metoxy-1,4-benzoquinol methylase
MVFTNPRPPVEDIEGHYGKMTLGGPSRLDGKMKATRRVASFQLALGGRFSRGRRLLDFGCGAGGTVHEATLRGWDAVGIDLSPDMIQSGNRHWGFDRLLCCSLDEFVARAPEPFDFILCNQVVEHLTDPLGVCRTLAVLLRPEGILYVDVPNADQWRERLRRGKYLSPTGHLNHFTKKTLQHLVARAELEVVYATGAPSCLRIYQRLRLGSFSYPLARLTHRSLPAFGSGVCVIGRAPAHKARSLAVSVQGVPL